MNLEHIERNYRIWEQYLIEVMERTLEFGNSLINKELNLGVLDVVLKPIVKSFYNYWKNNDAKQGTLLQIKTTLDSGKYLCIHGNDSKEKFDDIVEKNFNSYLKGDQVYQFCKKNHKNFKKLTEIIKWAFISRIQESIILLKVNDNVDDYNSLIKAAFKTKEEAYKVLVKQLDFTDESIKIIEEDLTVLKIPTGKKILMETLRKGFDQTRINMIKNLDNIYK